MEDQLRALGIVGIRIEASVPGDVYEDVERRIKNKFLTRRAPMTATELACTMSHRRAWQLLLDRGGPAALVLEDDARLSCSLVEAISDRVLQEDWYDVVRFEGRRHLVRLGRTLSPKLAGRSIARLISPYDGAAAYVIRRQTAAAALDDARCYEMPIDEYLFNRPGIMERRVFQVYPALAIQEELVDSEAFHSKSSIRRPPKIVRRPSLRKKAHIAWSTISSFPTIDLWYARRRIRLAFRSE